MTYFNALYLNDKYDNGNFYGEYWCVNSTCTHKQFFSLFILGLLVIELDLLFSWGLLSSNSFLN